MKRILTVLALIVSVTIFGQTAKECFDKGISKEASVMLIVNRRI